MIIKQAFYSNKANTHDCSDTLIGKSMKRDQFAQDKVKKSEP